MLGASKLSAVVANDLSGLIDTTEVLQEIRMMRFREAYGGWQKSNLTQVEAAKLLGVCERTFRRYINRYEEKGLVGLFDKRLKQASHRRAPLDEVLAVAELYSKRHMGGM